MSAVNCAIGQLHSGVWEFQPGIQHFACCRQLINATSVASALQHCKGPSDAPQLRRAHQHTVVFHLCHQTSWLEGQSSRGVWQTIHSPARFYIFHITVVTCLRHINRDEFSSGDCIGSPYTDKICLSWWWFVEAGMAVDIWTNLLYIRPVSNRIGQDRCFKLN